MTEVDYGGGGHRTRLRDQQINCCVLGCPPAPVYKGARGRRPARRRARQGGSPTPTGSRTPPFLVGVGEGKQGREEEKEKGGRRPGRPSSSPTKAHEAQLTPRGFPVTPRYSDICSKPSGTFRCPNIVVQYIDLYVSTISRLLIMSVIISETPNYLRYIKTQKLIIPIVTKL